MHEGEGGAALAAGAGDEGGEVRRQVVADLGVGDIGDGGDVGDRVDELGGEGGGGVEPGRGGIEEHGHLPYGYTRANFQYYQGVHAV